MCQVCYNKMQQFYYKMQRDSTIIIIWLGYVITNGVI